MSADTHRPLSATDAAAVLAAALAGDPLSPPAGANRLLVTGGSRGIGAATARLAACHGWDVAINYVHRRDEAERLADELRALGRRAITVQADVADEAQVVAMFEAVDREFGGLDALVNNAGVVDTNARLDEMGGPRLRRMVEINLLGTLYCAREAVRRLSTRHGGAGGAIVNLSSVAARLGSPGTYVDYAAAKAAVDTLSVGLAREVAAEGVRVNAVRPGIIDTEIHASGGQPDRVARVAPTLPMQRAGLTDEVAQAIVWLLSPAASYTSGAVLDVSGAR
ncbi:MAG TPA: SDR family oxidoreductase [Burkholderiaceae bacterium]|nr:SDR family oxidoreductase [Burkholderiaceae bacterium]HMX09586.1 SDR family oxidoreductase [Burkholderiaceae bacterium]HMZ00426.1 SDR family oxidoreductase [Burkholderiaceae bacterium]HNG78739.1 SDR family oxidoreductase [Burkholderiaceae bacterium]